LEEGLAEVFSTVRIQQRECFVGGDLPQRLETLRHSAWIPIPELLSLRSDTGTDRARINMFYAESWALTDMLIFSPEYAPHFGELLGAVALEESDNQILEHVYRKDAEPVYKDLEAWTRTSRAAVALPGVTQKAEPTTSSAVSDADARSVLADLLLALNKLDQAQVAYEELAREQPRNASFQAALGEIALRKQHVDAAREYWRRALQLGIADAKLCYRYAVLAEDAGIAPQEIREALVKAIALEPYFDDARYKLALLDANSSDYEGAIEQFRGMSSISTARGYGYWTAFASALTETGQRAEAKMAAETALRYASTPEERATAIRLAYAAETDLTVQLARDGNGNLKMVTARKPHGSDDWNPFIEAGDKIHRAHGRIGLVECTAGKITGFRIEDSSTSIEVVLQDPSHVLIRGGTPDFVCGAQDGRTVEVEYAVSGEVPGQDGILRGMRFR
jgi:tetratricopeptide (TPR) repeat protein